MNEWGKGRHLDWDNRSCLNLKSLMDSCHTSSAISPSYSFTPTRGQLEAHGRNKFPVSICRKSFAEYICDHVSGRDVWYNSLALSNNIIVNEMKFLFDCEFFVRMMAAWLLQQSSVGPGLGCLSSTWNVWSHMRCCPAVLSLIYSDSVDDMAAIVWCLLDQPMAPPLLIKTKPEVDLEVSQSLHQSVSVQPWKSIPISTDNPW